MDRLQQINDGDDLAEIHEERRGRRTPRAASPSHTPTGPAGGEGSDRDGSRTDSRSRSSSRSSEGGNDDRRSDPGADADGAGDAASGPAAAEAPRESSRPPAQRPTSTRRGSDGRPLREYHTRANYPHHEWCETADPRVDYAPECESDEYLDHLCTLNTSARRLRGHDSFITYVLGPEGGAPTVG